MRVVIGLGLAGCVLALVFAVGPEGRRGTDQELFSEGSWLGNLGAEANILDADTSLAGRSAGIVHSTGKHRKNSYDISASDDLGGVGSGSWEASDFNLANCARNCGSGDEAPSRDPSTAKAVTNDMPGRGNTAVGEQSYKMVREQPGRSMFYGDLGRYADTDNAALSNDARTSSNPHCNHIVGPAITKIDASWLGNKDVRPGDIICVEGGPRGPLSISAIQGTAKQPITFININGTVTINNTGHAGLYIRNSSHLRITGTGVSTNCGARSKSQDCGFAVHGGARGVVASEATTDIEIDHIGIDGGENRTTQAGMTLKSDYEFNGIRRDEFVQSNTYVHDNYFRNIGKEGIYIGSSHYDEGIDPILREVDVSYNLVEQTGWDGIQVGSATEACAIHGNVIRDYGIAQQQYQIHGIINNPGSTCNIHHNLIERGVGAGIYIQGNGNNQVYNNIIISAGVISVIGNGIGISATRGKDISILHNTIVGSRREGIMFRASSGFVANNLAVATGGRHIDPGRASMTNNLELQSLSEALLDERLCPVAFSPAVDRGTSRANGLLTDYYYRNRPNGNGYDIGACELQE